MRQQLNHPRRHARRRGVAMILVIIVIALGAILGYAMLASASIQSQVRHNTEDAIEAQALAESGMDLALYYMQYNYYAPPAQLAAHPSYLSSLGVLYWTGTGGPVALPGGGDGTIDVAVTPIAKEQFRITSVGRSGAGASAVARTLSADVAISTEYQVRFAGAFNEDVTVPLNSDIRGDLFGGKNVVIKNLLGITGSILFGSTVYGADESRSTQVRPGAFAAPSNLTEIKDYTALDLNNNGFPDVVPSSATTIPAGTTLKASTSNPAGIFYYTGNLTLASNVTIEGTLIVKGSLSINGQGVRVISRTAGHPALLVGGDVLMGNALGSRLYVEGLGWVGGKVTAGALNTPQLEVKGALLVNGAQPLFPSTTLASVRLEFDEPKAKVTDLTEKARTVLGVRVLRWNSSSS